MRTYSTEEVANAVGIHRITLQRWLSDGKVKASLSMPMSGRTLWRWTGRDLARVRKYKEKFYRKGRGRKKKPKA